jgi:hypothetical protein
MAAWIVRPMDELKKVVTQVQKRGGDETQADTQSAVKSIRKSMLSKKEEIFRFCSLRGEKSF